MRLLAALLLLLTAVACHRTETAPAPIPPHALVVHFLDQDGVLPLDGPSGGDWSFMNMGAWDRLEVRWKEGGNRGDAVVGQVAPDWLLLRDPSGDIHRIVLRQPEPEAIREDRDPHYDPEDEALAFWFGLAWILSLHHR
ncbi:MAG TPA: hypothetical protein VJ600_08645 [Holophagaceae bacterium]|nr:hypothetical protein [Holophagaceae bacterium]